jgi:cytidine deaminase
MTDQELIRRAMAAREYAYCPYSGFSVGAALLCADGTVYTGCNVENAAYGSSICAERTALVKAVSEGKREFVKLAVAGGGGEFCTPCGACRQMLYEFAPELTVLSVRGDGAFLSCTLRELLPYGFGASNLSNP